MMRFRAGPEVVIAHADFDTEADRDAFVARFPKYVGLHPNVTYYATGSPPRPSVSFHVTLKANGVTGAVNETGMKRARALLAGLDASEIEFYPNEVIKSLDNLKALVS